MTTGSADGDTISSSGRTHRRVFAIGACSYDDPEWGNLPHVARDVPMVIDALAAFGYEAPPAFPRGFIDPPTAADLQDALVDWLEEVHVEGDTLVVYHAGHGVDEEPHYLACSKTRNEMARVKSTALAAPRLVEAPGDVGVERLLVILDACYAGDGAAHSLAAAAKSQFVTASGIAAQRRHWASLSILAAARSGEPADDGAFATAFADVLRDSVLRDRILAGQRPRYVHLSDIVAAVNRRFEQRGSPQRADYAVLHDDGIGFFPNPHYVPGLAPDLDLAEQRTLTVQYQARVGELTDFFAPRARGVHAPGQSGHYFIGRTRILTRLARWLTGQDESDLRIFQITGPPGVGKSSVLGRLVARSAPVTRVEIPETTVLLSTDIPPRTIDLAVHAAHKTLTDILDAFADVLGIESTGPTEIIAALAARTRPLIAVIDALDEAGSGGSDAEVYAITDFLHRAAARAPLLRLLLGARPHVFDAFTPTEGVVRVNLGEPEWAEPRDIAAYAEQLLAAPHGAGSETDIPEHLVARAALEIAQVADRNYLIARLTARALADAKRPFWQADPSLWPTLLPDLNND